MSEWMKIMLEEISRKKAEAEQARIEEQRRGEEGEESALCYSPRSAPPE
ncbi:MAG: hypothetical protein QOK23_150 [Gammaproteobacteria bacterium]|jgi:hypothetical protein|nr:hypothetical protein [Gammaproteobacteria bacterium]MEA3137981.1 hypothetical protein [Gammaproteobacteria bacterium]